MGHQPPAVIPDQLLGRQPARALHIGALDLADIQRRVQAGPGIVQDIGAQDAVFARQPVDHHLGDRGAIGEVEERPPLTAQPVPGKLGCRVKPRRRKRNPRHIGRRDDLGKAPALARCPHLPGVEDYLGRGAARARGDEVGQPAAQGLAGVLHRHAVHVCPRRGRRGRGIGHFRSIGRGDPHLRRVDPQNCRRDLHHLRMQPLTHLGAAVVERDRAIGIDLHQRARLIEMGQREGNPELHRRKRNPTRQGSICAIPIGNFGLPRGKIRRFLQACDQLGQHAVFHLLAIMRRLVFLGPNTLGGGRGGRGPPRLRRIIEIQRPQLGRIPAHDPRQMLDRAFHPQQPLRAAETAKGGVRLRIRAQPMALDAQRGDEIAAIGMQHGAVTDRQAQIRRPAATRQMHEIGADKFARSIGADPVADAEIMPLAGDHHVVVAVVAHLAGPPGRQRRHGAGNRQMIALTFLAAKAPAHPPHLDPDIVKGQPQSMGDLVLDLRRMLAGTVDDHTALGGQRQCRLSLKVEMLLPADLERAFGQMRRPGQGGFDIAPRPDHRPALEPAVRRKRLIERQNRRARCIGDARLARRDPCRAMAGGGDQKDRLADAMHLARGQNRLGVRRGRGVVVVRQVRRGENGHHPGAAPHRVQIQRGDLGRSFARQAEGQMQRVRGAGQVIKIARLSGHMRARRVMRQRLANAHGITSSTETGRPESSRT